MTGALNTSTQSESDPGIVDSAVLSGGAALRALKAVFSRRRTSTEQAINQTYFYNFQLWELDGNAAGLHNLLDEATLDVDDSTLNNQDRQLPPLAVETKIRFTFVPYDSSTTTTKAETGWVEVSLNGVVVARLSPKNSIHPNTTGDDYGGAITVASASKWHGLCVEGGSYNDAGVTLSGLPSHAFGGRLVRTQSQVTPPINPGSSDVIAFTAGQVDVGTLGVESALTTCTATASALLGREVQTATMLTTITAISSSPRTYVFAVDSVSARIIDPIGRTVNNWTNTTGVTPLETCRIIGVWRGRFFLANYDGNPSYWALSKIVKTSNDAVATDLWTTGGSDPTRAFAGTASDSPGVSGSAVTAFAEFDNGRAFMGCASECFMFDGDPGYGGRLLKISSETGVLGPRAVAFDEEGNLYFVGPAGLFVVAKGSSDIKNVSGNRLTSILNEVDTSTTLVELVYDSQKRTMMIFLTPRQRGVTGIHAALETAENALWTDELPDDLQPLGVCKITGQARDDRRYLIGGWDGYIRRPVKGKADDDGSPIDCLIRYPTVEAEESTHRLSIVELQGTGCPGSGPTTWEVRTGASAIDVTEQAIDGPVSPAATGTWFETASGAQAPVRLRAGGGCVQIVLRQTSANETFAVERVTVRVKDLGPRRF